MTTASGGIPYMETGPACRQSRQVGPVVCGGEPRSGGRLALHLAEVDALVAALEAALVERADRHVVPGSLGTQRADGALLLGPVDERVERVPLHRVLVRDLVQLRSRHIGRDRHEL